MCSLLRMRICMQMCARVCASVFVCAYVFGRVRYLPLPILQPIPLSKQSLCASILCSAFPFSFYAVYDPPIRIPPSHRIGHLIPSSPLGSCRFSVFHTCFSRVISYQEEKEEEDDDDDDFDMFASDDEEDAEAEKIKQERLAAYAAKKSKKPAVIAKSSVLLGINV